MESHCSCDDVIMTSFPCRVVVFVDQMSELLDLALEKYHSLTDAQREELATYIIPEVIYIYLPKYCAENQSSHILSYVFKGRMYVTTVGH